MEFRSGETGFGGLISSGRFLPIHLPEKAGNFDAVRELLGEVLARVPFYSLVDLQDVIGVKIGVGLFVGATSAFKALNFSYKLMQFSTTVK